MSASSRVMSVIPSMNEAAGNDMRRTITFNTPEDGEDRVTPLPSENENKKGDWNNVVSTSLKRSRTINSVKRAQTRSWFMRLLCGCFGCECGRQGSYEHSEYLADLYLRELNLRITFASMIGIAMMVLHNQCKNVIAHTLIHRH